MDMGLPGPCSQPCTPWNGKVGGSRQVCGSFFVAQKLCTTDSDHKLKSCGLVRTSRIFDIPLSTFPQRDHGQKQNKPVTTDDTVSKTAPFIRKAGTGKIRFPRLSQLTPLSLSLGVSSLLAVDHASGLQLYNTARWWCLVPMIHYHFRLFSSLRARDTPTWLIRKGEKRVHSRRTSLADFSSSFTASITETETLKK